MQIRPGHLANILLILFALTARASAATLPKAAAQPDASRIMAQAETTAASQHKHILAVFSASWCGPCHLLEKFLNDPITGPIMNQAFVIVRLDVLERLEDNRHTDTPGGMKLMSSMGGSQGIPFYAMLNANGKPIVNSISHDSQGFSGNIGYPAQPREIDWFMHMLHEAAPSISAQQTETIQAWLQERAKSLVPAVPHSRPVVPAALKQTII